jgi:hypothetical protein
MDSVSFVTTHHPLGLLSLLPEQMEAIKHLLNHRFFTDQCIVAITNNSKSK